MGLVLVVLLLIPGVRLRNVPAGIEFGLEGLTGLIIPAMAAENSLRGAGLLIQAILDHQEDEPVMTRRSCCWSARRRGARRCKSGGSAMPRRRDGRAGR
jgi:hypothetical protein